MPTFTGGSSGYSPLILSGGGGGGSTDALTVYASGVAGESLSVGDVVRFDRVGSPGRLLKAIATSEAASDVVGIVKSSSVVAGQACDYYLIGNVNVKYASAPSANSNGSKMYLSPTTAGTATTVLPSTVGQVIVQLGYVTGANGATLLPTSVFRVGMTFFL